MRASREEQLREIFRDAIVGDLLTLYTTPQLTHGKSPVDEFLEGLDGVLGIDKRRIFIETLKEAVAMLEAPGNEEASASPLQK